MPEELPWDKAAKEKQATEKPVVKDEPVATAEDDDDEDVAPSFSEIRNGAKREVAEAAGRVKKAGLSPFRRAVDDVVDRGIDILDTLADVWAKKKRKEKE